MVLAEDSEAAQVVGLVELLLVSVLLALVVFPAPLARSAEVLLLLVVAVVSSAVDLPVVSDSVQVFQQKSTWSSHRMNHRMGSMHLCLPSCSCRTRAISLSSL